jgi:hypothetical protein
VRGGLPLFEPRDHGTGVVLTCQCTHNPGKLLAPRSNLGSTNGAPKRAYHGLNVQIEPLRIGQSDLNTKRILDLMAVSQDDGPMPLYLHTVHRILREMRTEQQKTEIAFDYQNFKRRLMDSAMSPTQLGPLNQRLDTLESFMPRQTAVGQVAIGNGNDWTSVVRSTYAPFTLISDRNSTAASLSSISHALVLRPKGLACYSTFV